MAAATQTIRAQYSANATFEKGPAVVQLDLIKHDNQWQVLGFFVRSPVLEQAQQKPPQPQQPGPPQQQPH